MEEAVNDCCWDAWRQAGDFRGDARVSTWLMGIAYRCGLKALRRQGDESIDDAVLPALECGVDPNEDRELRDLLNRALQPLGPDQRVLIELVYGVGHRLAEEIGRASCRDRVSQHG